MMPIHAVLILLYFYYCFLQVAGSYYTYILHSYTYTYYCTHTTTQWRVSWIGEEGSNAGQTIPGSSGWKQDLDGSSEISAWTLYLQVCMAVINQCTYSMAVIKQCTLFTSRSLQSQVDSPTLPSTN
jgi:hypothetical protein